MFSLPAPKFMLHLSRARLTQCLRQQVRRRLEENGQSRKWKGAARARTVSKTTNKRNNLLACLLTCDISSREGERSFLEGTAGVVALEDDHGGCGMSSYIYDLKVLKQCSRGWWRPKEKLQRSPGVRGWWWWTSETTLSRRSLKRMPFGEWPEERLVVLVVSFPLSLLFPSLSSAVSKAESEREGFNVIKDDSNVLPC